MSGTSESPHSAETERIRRLYEKEAPKFDRSMGRWDRTLFAGSREWVCAQASGDVLEIAIGTARNLPFYPADIRLTGVELSPAMIEVAQEQAEKLDREVDLRVGDAEALEFADASFDTVICTYSLCTIPDDRAAVREAKRVLRPGGKFVLAEHVRSPIWVVRMIERLIEPLAVRFGGDHLTREPLEHLEAEGFRVEEVKRSKLGIVELVTARKP
ncbi:MAG TPA: methyltransferase domain-containing protein [Solirubrobacterales bacterium]|nr:methyltransferase domain-containing protein [Solirubrobacterales bacterium]